MKKIFGLLSLIAILTVSFATQASTIDAHDEVVSYDLSDEVASFDLAIEVSPVGAGVTPSIIIGSTSEFSGLPVINEDFGGVASVNIVTGLGNSPFIGLDNSSYSGLPDVIPLPGDLSAHTSNETLEANTYTKDWFGTHNGKIRSTKLIS